MRKFINKIKFSYKLYDVIPNEKQHPALAAWESEKGFDFFRLRNPGMPSTVLVAPERIFDFESFLSQTQIPFEVLFDDYEKPLEEERAALAKNRMNGVKGYSEGRANFAVYWRYPEMEAYIDDMAARFPQFLTKETLIVSPQGRNIYAVKISSGVFGQKPIIAMESGMHAREW